MLQMADKLYKKHLTIGKILNEQNYIKISELTQLNLIILNNENNHLIVSEYTKPNFNKWVVCYKFYNYYFPVWNFEKKYFNFDSSFIKYLQTISKNSHTNVNNDSEKSFETEILNNKHDVLHETEKKCNKDSLTLNKINDNKILIETNLKNNDGYEEFVTNENYALYISEAIDTKNTHKQKIRKSTEANIIVIGEKKKNKSNKNIFVTQEQKDIVEEIKINEEVKNNNIEKNVIENKITNLSLDDYADSSVFKKTEIIDKNKISKIISNIKSTTKLEQIQAFALELGLSIISGSTKDGKPKNKTKNEIIEEIKKLDQ